MKKIIVVFLALMLLVGCTTSGYSGAAALKEYEQSMDWEDWEVLVAKEHEEMERLIFENIEIETFETNTNYWD